jgi:hypothetical protein
MFAVEGRYYEYIKLNGKEVRGKKGVFSAPQYIFDMALKTKKSDLEECYKKYER